MLLFSCAVNSEESPPADTESLVSESPDTSAGISSPDPTQTPAIVTTSAEPEPEPSPVKDENGILIGSAVFEASLKMMGNNNGINVREQPNTDCKTVAIIGLGQVVEVDELVNGWYKVTVLPGMQKGFIRSDLLVDFDENKKFVAKARRQTIDVLNKETGEMEPKKSNLVDVRRYLPDIEYYIIFATPDNFTGKTLYARDLCLLQKGTVDKLVKAQKLFEADGYTIKIYDAYRPSKVSGALYNIIKDPKYIASAGTSIHNRGAAVDMTLVDSNGNELEMPTPMHTLNETANRDYKDMTDTARKNMDYMTGVMRKCGFGTINSEWWHFSDSNANAYPPLDIDFAKISVEELI